MLQLLRATLIIQGNQEHQVLSRKEILWIDMSGSGREILSQSFLREEFCWNYRQGTKSFGGCREESILKKLTGWDVNPSKGYPSSSSILTDSAFAFSDQVPLFLARVLALCVQANTHPLLHPNIAQLTPSGNTTDATIGWTLNSMVVGPIEALQTLSIKAFEDERFNSWVIMTLWKVHSSYHELRLLTSCCIGPISELT